jgi:hypothetical protein
MVKAQASGAELALRSIERLVKAQVPVEQLERFIALQERILAQAAKAEADDAFASMQADLPTIGHRGEIWVRGVLRSTFAKFEDIVDAVRPVCQKWGFSFRFETSYVEHGMIEVACILSHRRGHDRRSVFRSLPDDSGAKTLVQQDASARSYCKRYTLTDVLGLATRGDDTDGTGDEGAGGAYDEATESQDGRGPRRSATGQPDSRPAYSAAGDTRLISEPQMKRLMVIMGKAKRPEEVVKAWAFGRYGITSRKQLTREMYEDFCNAIEGRGELPAGQFKATKREREVGEEG